MSEASFSPSVGGQSAYLLTYLLTHPCNSYLLTFCRRSVCCVGLLLLLAIATLGPKAQLSIGTGNRGLTRRLTEENELTGAGALQQQCQTMLPQLIVFNTWHKAGTVLAGSLLNTLYETCPRTKIGIGSDSALHRSGLCQPLPHRFVGLGLPSQPPSQSKLHQIGGIGRYLAAQAVWRQSLELQSILHGGSTTHSVSVHLNSASYIRLHVPHACVVALPAARTRFIHFIREPFAVVSSFFLFHLTGQECGFRDMLVVCAAMRRGAGQQKNVSHISSGLTHALQVSVDKLLTSPLPQMAELYIALRGFAHTLTLRMESFQRDFDGTVEQLLGFLQVMPSTWLYSKLLSEMHKHDVRRWHPSKVQQSDHVNPGRAVGLSSETVLTALAQNEKQTRSLTNLSQVLGYNLNALDLARSRTSARSRSGSD